MITDGNVAYATDIKEAVERTHEADALRFEAAVRKFNGDKIAAEKYLSRKTLTQANSLKDQADVATKRIWGQ
jgi:hypothetical protein